MQKRVLLAASILVLSLLVMLQGLLVSDANPLPWFADPQMSVSIQFPTNGTITSLPVWVNFTSLGDGQFTVSDDTTKEWVRSFFYVIDEQNMKTSGLRFETKNTTITGPSAPKYCSNFSGQACITNLEDGPHTITVYYGAVNRISYVGTPQESIYYSPYWQATAQFYVDSNLASGLTITPSPTPTQSIPTINTGDTLPVELNPSIVYITLAIVTAIIAVASITLVYFKKHKRNAV